MTAALLLTGVLLAQPAAEPPIAGRPPDWSGVIGGPYVVTMTADRPALAADDRVTITVQMSVAVGGSAGTLRDVKRPALAKMEAYKAFAIEDLDDSFSENPPRREFRYTLRPRWSGVNEVPRLKFVYFNPRPGRYQTTYSESPITLIVTPGVAPRSPAVPREVPDWMLECARDPEIYGWPRNDLEYELEHVLFTWFGIKPDRSGGRRIPTLVCVLAACLPPVLCVVWFVMWRRGNPDAARLARIRRSRAASVALRSLREPTAEPAAQVFAAIAGYLQARLGVSTAAANPTETGQELRRLGHPVPLIDSTVALLQRCVTARFAPVREFDPLVANEAERVILEWEGQPCSQVGA